MKKPTSKVLDYAVFTFVLVGLFSPLLLLLALVWIDPDKADEVANAVGIAKGQLLNCRVGMFGEFCDPLRLFGDIHSK